MRWSETRLLPQRLLQFRRWMHRPELRPEQLRRMRHVLCRRQPVVDFRHRSGLHLWSLHVPRKHDALHGSRPRRMPRPCKQSRRLRSLRQRMQLRGAVRERHVPVPGRRAILQRSLHGPPDRHQQLRSLRQAVHGWRHLSQGRLHALRRRAGCWDRRNGPGLRVWPGPGDGMRRRSDALLCSQRLQGG
jgi:hypothetical protein